AAAPPADAVPPAPANPPAIDAGSPDAAPADLPAPAPGDVTGAPGEPQQASNVDYLKQLWDAIRGQDIHGNDALDAFAKPSNAR
ncbi:MAG TPA: resuscitation-promoting factor RpfA, partial [Mycobacterium sp.]|nr:resuscitation-promoting factor RpfA [Mycobacterium sp.]